MTDAGQKMTTNPYPLREPKFGVPLAWRDDRTGYQCPACSLYVARPKANWATCPRCPGIPIEELADMLLIEVPALDESDRQAVIKALRPILDRAAKR